MSRPDPTAPRRPHRTAVGLLLALLTVTSLLLLRPAGAAATPVVPARPVVASPAGSVPNARPLYLDPSTWAMWAMTAYPSSTASNSVIAGTPQAHWFTNADPTSSVAARVSAYVGAATRVGQLPVLTLYAIPHRDCGSYSAGGFGSAKAYGAWIAQVRRGLGRRPAVVILEPDALAGMSCLSTKDQTTRYAILKAAVGTLTADPATLLYVDAGHSRWHLSATIANRLKKIGAQRARGFALNVGNFYTTKDEIRYGEKVSKLLGGSHYVIDTSRNGLGPATGALAWCNPAGRALGSKPTLKTAGAHADAYLWIKHPGESDGSCGRQQPKSGTWFNAYAVGLVQRSAYRR